MEKLRKFEDPQHGVNPFAPDPVRPRTGIYKLVYFAQLLIGLVKFPFFILTYVNFICAHILKHFLLVPKAVRVAEIIIDKIYCTILLYLLGVFQFNYKFKGNQKYSPRIIISNQSSIIEWLSLMHTYSPKFLWLAKSSDHKSDYLYELNSYNVLFYGIGLKFINAGEKRYTPFNLDKYIKSNNQVPLVIFPEATKTNKKGALSVKSNIMSKLYEILGDNPRFPIRAVSFACRYKHFSPYNTVENSGLKNLFYTTVQLINHIEIISQDVQGVNFDKNTKYDTSKFKTIDDYFDSEIQSLLVLPENRYCLSLDCFKHIEFLEYFHSTADDGSYALKNE